MANNTDTKKPSTKRTFSRWTLAASALCFAAIVFLFLPFVKTGVLIATAGFIVAIVALVIQIRNGDRLKGLPVSIIVLILLIILCIAHLAVLVYNSEPMSLARDLGTYFDKEDVDQEFSNVAALTATGSGWKELRSEELGYVFQHPENWTVDVSTDEKIVIVQWKKGEEAVSVECKILFTMGELRAEQTLADYIADSYNWLEKEHSTEDIAVSSYAGYRTYIDQGDFGFTDWLSSGGKVFSFKQENSGGEKEDCEKITARIEESFSFTGSE